MSSLPSDYVPPTASIVRAGATLPVRPKDNSATKEYGLSHTMIRAKDPSKTLPFYIDTLGMTLVHESPSQGGKFTNYFLLFPQSPVPEKEEERKVWLWQQQGIVEICHNWGTENDASFKYHSGNEPEHKGFGHLCIYVDSLEAACKRFTDLGVPFKKRPEEGTMRHIAFILDPDGYWVEVIAKGQSA